MKWCLTMDLNHSGIKIFKLQSAKLILMHPKKEIDFGGIKMVHFSNIAIEKIGFTIAKIIALSLFF